MEQQGETRAFNREGELINSSFLYLNESTGKYEIRSLKDHLKGLGLLDESQKMSESELNDYYKKLQQIINS